MANGNDKKKLGDGGVPGTAIGNPTPPPIKKADAKTPSEPGRVTREEKSLLDLPLRRLPIGWQTDLTADLSRFRLWIPTDTGGTLEIEYGSVAFGEGLESGTVDLERPFRTVLQKSARKVTYEVKAEEYGEFFVIAAGKAGDYISCSFTQVSFSREGAGDSDTPLIPWNFFYWPTAASEDNPYYVAAGDVMAHYGKAFGHDPEECRKTEHEDHGTDPVDNDRHYNSEGHCHNAAPASALFEKPQDTTYNNQTFTEKELKYLAAEYFGNFGVMHKVWELNRHGKPKNARFYLPAYFRPGETPKTKAKLISALSFELGAGKAQEAANDATTTLPDDAALEKQVNQWMGELAAEFYQALIDNMRVQKQPLVSNMRSYYLSGGPDQIWNQVYFCYSVNYSEHNHDENDMIIEGFLYANLDEDLTSFPAKIVDNKPMFTVGKGPEFLWFSIKWRIVFDGKGKIIVHDVRNEWRQLSNDKGDPLYPPTDLLQLAAPTATTRPSDKHLAGNKFVGTGLVKEGLLRLHKRYQ